MKGYQVFRALLRMHERIDLDCCRESCDTMSGQFSGHSTDGYSSELVIEVGKRCNLHYYLSSQLLMIEILFSSYLLLLGISTLHLCVLYI